MAFARYAILYTTLAREKICLKSIFSLCFDPTAEYSALSGISALYRPCSRSSTTRYIVAIYLVSAFLLFLFVVTCPSLYLFLFWFPLIILYFNITDYLWFLYFIWNTLIVTSGCGAGARGTKVNRGDTSCMLPSSPSHVAKIEIRKKGIPSHLYCVYQDNYTELTKERKSGKNLDPGAGTDYSSSLYSIVSE